MTLRVEGNSPVPVDTTLCCMPGEGFTSQVSASTYVYTKGTENQVTWPSIDFNAIPRMTASCGAAEFEAIVPAEFSSTPINSLAVQDGLTLQLKDPSATYATQQLTLNAFYTQFRDNPSCHIPVVL